MIKQKVDKAKVIFKFITYALFPYFQKQKCVKTTQIK